MRGKLEEEKAWEAAHQKGKGQAGVDQFPDDSLSGDSGPFDSTVPGLILGNIYGRP
ncbi:MAG: hypothetical protein O7D93_12250 [Acidobacteria bacterium]|nr:hypothetical protein [Acidobacteriota bacterium]